MQNLENTILAQYANSPTIMSVIESWNSALDPSTNINNFYNNVWNIETAVGYGLQVWGRIVGIGNTVQIAGGIGMPFGFKEATTASASEFGQSNFYSGQQASSNYVLSDSAYRVLILAKALTNISNCASGTYNQLLMSLFPNRGNAYVNNSGNMSATLTFEFLLQPYEIAIIKTSGAIQPPTGVYFRVLTLQLPYVFGFLEADSGAQAIAFSIADVNINGTPTVSYTFNSITGNITFATAPAAASVLTWDGTATSVANGVIETATAYQFGTGDGVTTTFNILNGMTPLQLVSSGSANSFNVGTFFQGFY